MLEQKDIFTFGHYSFSSLKWYHNFLKLWCFGSEVFLLPHAALFEPRRQKTGLRGFRPGPTQTGLYSHRRWPEAWNFGFRKKRYCTIQVAKTKTLISFAVTAKLICVFVFAYAKIRFSHVAAHFTVTVFWPSL